MKCLHYRWSTRVDKEVTQASGVRRLYPCNLFFIHGYNWTLKLSARRTRIIWFFFSALIEQSLIEQLKQRILWWIISRIAMIHSMLTMRNQKILCFFFKQLISAFIANLQKTFIICFIKFNRSYMAQARHDTKGEWLLIVRIGNTWSRSNPGPPLNPVILPSNIFWGSSEIKCKKKKQKKNQTKKKISPCFLYFQVRALRCCHLAFFLQTLEGSVMCVKCIMGAEQMGEFVR